MQGNKARCPDCGNMSVRRRGVNTPANIARRKIKERRHRYICDNCEWTGTRADIDWEETPADDAASAMEW